MEILKKGLEVIIQGDLKSPDENWPKVRICTGDGNNNDGCGAALLINKSDLYQTSLNYHGYAVDGVQPFLTSYYLTFTCPCCNAETDSHGASDLPYLSSSNEDKLVVNE
jgi:hypothetical protein